MDKSSLSQASKIIKSGELVAFPTETVYGLGANALNPQAVARIFAAKQRPFFDPLIVHISHIERVKELAADIPPVAEKLMKTFWPGPLTIILKKKEIVPDIVTGGLDSVAIRMPDHPIALKLIELSGCPLAAPSANPFGRLSPTMAIHVKKHLGSSVDLIIDGGKCSKGLESTIIDVTEDTPKVLRVGALAVEEIESIIGKVKRPKKKSAAVTPGSLPYHYAPKTKVILLKRNEPFPKITADSGYLVFGPLQSPLDYHPHALSLSLSKDLVEAAANLFEYLHRLDNEQLKVIYIKPIPSKGLGAAIMDRLRKAANTFRQEKP